MSLATSKGKLALPFAPLRSDISDVSCLISKLDGGSCAFLRSGVDFHFVSFCVVTRLFLLRTNKATLSAKSKAKR
jgi:hypothetical protein